MDSAEDALYLIISIEENPDLMMTHIKDGRMNAKRGIWPCYITSDQRC